MPVGDCERAFAAAAREDGLDLARGVEPWLNRRGHLGLPDLAAPAAAALEKIFLALGGDLAELAARTTTALRGDFVHTPTGTLIEIDESQHFTTARALTLSMYPDDAPLGYDLDHYRDLCAALAPRSDRDFAHKSAPAFGPRGRQRQRAYNDALRDLARP